MCEKLYYKVVKVFPRGELISSFSAYNFLYYRVGEEVFPRIGKLFCFGTLKEARDYLRARNWPENFAIYSCRVVSPKNMEMSPGSNLNDKDLQDYFNSVNTESLDKTLRFLPCVICNSITLLEKVEDEEKY